MNRFFKNTCYPGIFIPLTCLLLALTAVILCGCDDGDNGTDAPTLQQVTAILESYRDQVKPGLSASIVAEVEQYAAGFPIEEPAGVEPVQITATDNESLDIIPTINRRDWAYAERGIGYTFIGGLQQGQKQLLDVGFWCFLEAALLKTDEPEHLANVGFHLNDREQWDDADKILRYALSLGNDSAAALNNIAYTCAAQNNFTGAVAYQLQATELWPGDSQLSAQLARYYREAGATDAAEAIESTLDLDAGSSTGSYELPSNLSARALRTVDAIDGMVDDMEDDLEDLENTYQSQVDAATPAYESRLDATSATYAECVIDVISQGWGSAAENLYAQCLNCEMPNIHSSYGIQFEMYQKMTNIWSRFEVEATELLGTELGDAKQFISLAGISATEQEDLKLYAHNSFFSQYSDRIWGPVADIDRLWKADLTVYRNAVEDGCGDAPVGELSQVKERDIACEMFPFFCKKWSIWFGIGSFSWDPNGLCELTLGEGGQIKLGYNFGTKSFSVGAGLGFNVGIISTGATVRFSTAKGLEGAVEVEPAKPFLLVGPLSAPSVAFSKMGSFMN